MDLFAVPLGVRYARKPTPPNRGHIKGGGGASPPVAPAAAPSRPLGRATKTEIAAVLLQSGICGDKRACETIAGRILAYTQREKPVDFAALPVNPEVAGVLSDAFRLEASSASPKKVPTPTDNFVDALPRVIETGLPPPRAVPGPAWFSALPAEDQSRTLSGLLGLHYLLSLGDVQFSPRAQAALRDGNLLAVWCGLHPVYQFNFDMHDETSRRLFSDLQTITLRLQPMLGEILAVATPSRHRGYVVNATAQLRADGFGDLRPHAHYDAALGEKIMTAAVETRLPALSSVVTRDLVSWLSNIDQLPTPAVALPLPDIAMISSASTTDGLEGLLETLKKWDQSTQVYRHQLIVNISFQGPPAVTAALLSSLEAIEWQGIETFRVVGNEQREALRKGLEQALLASKKFRELQAAGIATRQSVRAMLDDMFSDRGSGANRNTSMAWTWGQKALQLDSDHWPAALTPPPTRIRDIVGLTLPAGMAWPRVAGEASEKELMTSDLIGFFARYAGGLVSPELFGGIDFGPAAILLRPRLVRSDFFRDRLNDWRQPIQGHMAEGLNPTKGSYASVFLPESTPLRLGPAIYDHDITLRIWNCLEDPPVEVVGIFHRDPGGSKQGRAANYLREAVFSHAVQDALSGEWGSPEVNRRSARSLFSPLLDVNRSTLIALVKLAPTAVKFCLSTLQSERVIAERVRVLTAAVTADEIAPFVAAWEGKPEVADRIRQMTGDGPEKERQRALAEMAQITSQLEEDRASVCLMWNLPENSLRNFSGATDVAIQTALLSPPHFCQQRAADSLESATRDKVRAFGLAILFVDEIGETMKGLRARLFTVPSAQVDPPTS